jgi:hypothetical protein
MNVRLILSSSIVARVSKLPKIVWKRIHSSGLHNVSCVSVWMCTCVCVELVAEVADDSVTGAGPWPSYSR